MEANCSKRKFDKIDDLNQAKKSEESDATEFDAHELLRRHFEARFEPLPILQGVKKINTETRENDCDSIESESEWDGISDGETGVQIIEHTESKISVPAMTRAEYNSFMSSKPPRNMPIKPAASSEVRGEDGVSEAANLKNDLALQRLLAESHLLDSAENLVVQGKNRHVATDLRIQALGSKYSILKQEKMPMSHRKGINAKKVERETKRRKEAKENGIILERATMGSKKKSVEKRDRGFGAPTIGRFSRGKLQLSTKDISEIEGPRKSFSRGHTRKHTNRGQGKSTKKG